MARVEYHRKKSTSMKWIIGGLLLSISVIISTILFILYPFASKEQGNYFSGDYPIIYKGVQIGNALFEGESVYFPLSVITEYMDGAIVYDEKSESIIITTTNKVIQMPTESLTYFINEEPVQLHFSPIMDERGELYIALDPIISYYPFQYHILPETKSVMIRENGEEIYYGQITDKDVHTERLRLRTEPTLKAPYVAQLVPSEQVMIEDEREEYYFVRKENGLAGFIEKDLVIEGNRELVEIEQSVVEHQLPEIKGPIQLTWEAVYSKNPDTSKIPYMDGINVVSPTWFELMNESGEVKNLGSLQYTNWAKSNGYQVWGLFSNGFDPDLTYAAFKDFETRQKIIRQLLHYSQLYELDGINIDIENVYPEHGPFVTQFVREATPYFHEAGLIVSMDITFIAGGNWSAFYEREKLAKIVDYLIVMAYDEHWSSSPVAGSVASFPWVEENLKKLLHVVPNDKLILGVPLYTRLWKVTDSGEVSSQALSMSQVEQWLEKHNVTPVYDPQSGQNYVERYVEEEQATYKIWIEDELSLRKRAELAIAYNLAGVASWSRYFANEKAWTALNLHSFVAKDENES